MEEGESYVLHSYIAIGDSFTEGIGDQRPDGSERGWADRVAAGLYQKSLSEEGTENPPFRYANLAIRGLKARPVVDTQLAPAIAQRPDLISINAGGNNMLRPRFDPTDTIDFLFEAVLRARDHGSHILLLAGPDPTKNLPFGETISRRGAIYTEMTYERIEGLEGITFVDNYSDRAFEDTTYWSLDGLHLSPAGHLRVAANCLDALGVSYPQEWGDPRSPDADVKNYRSRAYYAEHIAPWVGRRLRGRSSGDGRVAKRPFLTDFDPRYDL